MAPIVLVHGIFNHVRGMTPETAGLRQAAVCLPGLAEDVGKLQAQVPELVMAYYADQLRQEFPAQAQSARSEGDFEFLSGRHRVQAAEWLVAAGVPVPEDPQNVGLAPLRQMLGWLIDERSRNRLGAAVTEQLIHRLERVIVTNLREVEAYTTWPERRRLVRDRLATVVRRERPAVVIAHSLGSYVAYETLHA
ncbi:hypothetical protein [Streptomyces sp. NPDC046909]|uniref:hypothetical protein n=1 Tax=Streptomyces sp. NPDC046909 TaxID=3155617 RepID=UPI0033D15B6F